MAVIVLAVAYCFALSSVASAQPSEIALVRGSFANGSMSWTPQDFGWFYYDIDQDVGGERLSIETEGRTVSKGHLVYSSDIWSDDFEYEPWGRYEAVSFLGKPYFAGYLKSNFTDAVSSLEKGEMRQVLIDDDEVHALEINSTLPLSGGYSLAFVSMSVKGEKASLTLIKNGAQVYPPVVVSAGDTYAFKQGDLPLILIHISNAMGSADDAVVDIDAIFQISDSAAVRLPDGGKLDRMEVAEVSKDRIEMRNYGDLTLTRDSVLTVAAGLMFRVLDLGDLIYYPQGIISDYGVHDIRGPVYPKGSPVLVSYGSMPALAEARWNPTNFSGFYFDPEDLLGSEGLVLYKTTNRAVLPQLEQPKVSEGVAIVNGMQYTTLSQVKEFEYKPWGYYTVISFLGQLWFAGYNQNTSSDIGHTGTIDYDYLGQVLIDSDTVSKAVTGSVFLLSDGYQFLVKEVRDDRIFAQLLKDGKLLDNATITSNTTYIYKKDFGDVTDLPVIAIHVQNVFSNDTQSLAMIDGIFQIGDLALPVDEGRDFGELTIVVSTPGYIIMVNPESIDLKRDSSVALWPGVALRVADNDTLRYYLYTQSYVVPSPVLSYLGLPKGAVPSTGLANFTMSVLAGEITSVSADIVDPNGRTVFVDDLTNQGVGSEDQWSYSWQWRANLSVLSDDGSQILLSNQGLNAALLYLNDTTAPLSVIVEFDSAGRVSSISDKNAIYYVSQSKYSSLNQKMSYGEMLLNGTQRSKYMRIEVGKSKLKFSRMINGTSDIYPENHTIEGNLTSLEPHLLQVPAMPGTYKLNLRIENVMNALRVTGETFNVTASAPQERAVLLSSGTVGAGGVLNISLDVSPSGSERRVEIAYDPSVVNALGAGGSCDTPSYIDHEAGRISIIMPANCSFANVTFQALEVNATTNLSVVKVEGLQPLAVENGTISVLGSEEGKKLASPFFALSMVAMALAAIARRRR